MRKSQIPIKSQEHHWAATPMFWATIAILILTAIIAWPIISEWLPKQSHPPISLGAKAENTDSPRNISLNDSKFAVSRQDRIISPENGGTVLFRKGSGQGGLVTIEGESKQLRTDEAIILVVYPSDGNAYPQTNQPKGILPNRDGRWSADVQVGNLDNDPQAGQSFIVKMFVLTTKDYISVKDDNLNTGGRAKWPPPLLLAPPYECASAMFTLK